MTVKSGTWVARSSGVGRRKSWWTDNACQAYSGRDRRVVSSSPESTCEYRLERSFVNRDATDARHAELGRDGVLDHRYRGRNG